MVYHVYEYSHVNNRFAGMRIGDSSGIYYTSLNCLMSLDAVLSPVAYRIRY